MQSLTASRHQRVCGGGVVSSLMVKVRGFCQDLVRLLIKFRVIDK